MLHRSENLCLKGLNILEVSEGESGSYAGRLFANSGAKVTKIIGNSKKITNFTDMAKEIAVTTNVFKEVVERLQKPWDLILWDSTFSNELDHLFNRYFSENRSNVIGLKIELPQGLYGDEENYLQAVGGWMSLTGHPEKAPLRLGGNPAAYLVGAHAATAGLLAILERTWREKGRIVYVDALTVVVSALEGAFSTYLATGRARSRVGNRHHSLTPMSILPCRDGWIFVGAPVNENWELLKRWSGIQSPPEWSNMNKRMEHCIEIEKELSEWTRNETENTLFLTGQAFRLPFSKVQKIEQVRACPQLHARNFWIKKDTKIVNTNLPWKIRMNKQNGSKSFMTHVDAWQKLRILDLTNMWSGPYCTRIFADMGAEVIKVEASHRPDGIRANEGAASPFFRELNRNKLGINLDLRCHSDRDFFLKLVEQSDVLVENFSPRVMANFGLHAEKLWKHKSDLIIVSLSAFGQTGPFRNFVGYGHTLECMSGLASLTHYNDGVPWLPGFSVSDIGAGIHAAFALLTVLLRKKHEGLGAWIDLSQYETACQFTAPYLLEDYFQVEAGDNLITVKNLREIANEGQVAIMPLPKGKPVVGVPWKSSGWDVPNVPPPELGEHTNMIENRFRKKV